MKDEHEAAAQEESQKALKATAAELVPDRQLTEREESLMLALAKQIGLDSRIRIHYYVKIAVSTFLCALLLLIGVPVFMESRVTGSLSYTALGVVLVAFGLILALAVVILLFNPPFKARMRK